VWWDGGALRSGQAAVAAVSDENGRKRLKKLYFCFRFYIFLAKTGSGSENAGTETELEYSDIRKRTNTAGNSTETVGSRELKPEYRTSLFS
jgi:hypothetical protein